MVRSMCSLAVFAGLAACGAVLGDDDSRVPPSAISPLCDPLKEAADPNITPPVRIKGTWPGRPKGGTGDEKVWVMIRIDPEGRVIDRVLCYTNNSTYASEVMDAVRQWQYRPATREAQPVEYRLLVVIKSKERRN